MIKRPWDIGELAEGQIIDQFGQQLNPFQPMVGPVPVPWELWRWRWNPVTGHFKTVSQNFLLNTKTHEIQTKGFKETGVQGKMHPSGSPVFDKNMVEEVYCMAEKEQISLREALLLWAKVRKVGMNPDFVEAVERGPKKYPFPAPAAPPAQDPRDAEIARLKAELEEAKAQPGPRRRTASPVG